MIVDNVVLLDVEGIPEPAWLEQVEQFCLWVLAQVGYHDWEVSVLLCDDATIARLNQDYRGKDGPTDVLSFAQDDSDEDFGPPVEASGRFIAGDIVVAPDQVKENALRFGVDFDQELKRVLIHGILHLAGHDHETNSETEPMLILQEEILSKDTGGTRFLS